MMSDTPTREQIQEALSWIPSYVAAIRVGDSSLPLTALETVAEAARLWLEGPKVDEAMIERTAHALMVESWGQKDTDIFPSPIGWIPFAKRALRAALEVSDV